MCIENFNLTWLSKLLEKYPIIRFGVVGLMSTILDYSVLKLLISQGVGTYLATAIGFLVGCINGYIFNSVLVFKAKYTYVRYIKYLLVSLVGLLFTELIVKFLHFSTIKISIDVAKLVAVCVVFFWNYLMSRVWAFK